MVTPNTGVPWSWDLILALLSTRGLLMDKSLHLSLPQQVDLRNRHCTTNPEMAVRSGWWGLSLELNFES